MNAPRVLEIQPLSVPASHPASILLRHARVADPEGGSLERKPENIVQSPEYHGYRDAGLARLDRREKRNCRRVVGPCARASAVVFPVEPEAHAMRSSLPRHG